MKNSINIGLVICDECEYGAIKKIKRLNLKEKKFCTREGHTFNLTKGERTIKVWSVYSGTGKVNAAMAAQKMICEGVDALVNYGLSGGISGVCRGEDVIGSSFFEHDFDLTCLNYKPCEKPGQTYIYEADKCLVDMALKAAAPAKAGKLATGDCFVSDTKLKNLLRDEFGAMCCDMETAAIASVAYFNNVPFVSLRRVSDDAGDDATEDYREVNNGSQEEMIEKTLSVIEAFFDEESFWN